MTQLLPHSHCRLSAALLAIGLASSADRCLAQVWIMRKPKPMIDEQKRQQEEAKPKKKPAKGTERTRQRPAEPQLVMTSEHWRVTLSRCRPDGPSSAHCLIDVKIERRSSDVSVWFLPQWLTLWDRTQGESGDTAPRVTLPLHVTDGEGKPVRGPLEVEEVRRITFVFPRKGAEQIRFLDSRPSALAHIEAGE